MIKRLTTEQFIERATLTHGIKYDYSQVLYLRAFNPVLIICPIHGEFWQKPSDHIKCSGCPKCGNLKINKKKKFTQEEFIEIVTKKEIPNISFEKVVYDGKRKDIIITCKFHGDYTVKAELLLKGHGCAKCRSSVGEASIRKILKTLKIKFFEQQGFKGLFYKRTLKFDFYLPYYNACIEFDGEQHFKAVEFWRGREGFEELLTKDRTKKEFCELNKMPLLRIRFDEQNVEDRILDFINNLQTN